MINKDRRRTVLRSVLPFSVPAIWTLLFLVVGAFQLGEFWGPSSLAIGSLCAVVFVVAALLRSWFGAIYGVFFASAIAMVAASFLVLDGEPVGIGIGVVSVMILGASLPVALLLRERAPSAASAESATNGDLHTLLQQIREHSMLSDNAKRVLFRDRELHLLRSAIEADIARGDYDAAVTLCDEMANLFGYREEAEAFRSRIAQVRQDHYEAQVQAAMGRFEAHLVQRHWAAVHEEAARIRRLFPDSHLVADLDPRIMQAREEHKRELESQFLEAAQRDDVEAAMDLLKQLDLYLSREEAEQLTEVAQGVIVRHRENLGAQFKLAVNGHRWAQAAQLGEAIVAEFPNSKMAAEVHSMIDVLRTRATDAALTAEGPT